MFPNKFLTHRITFLGFIVTLDGVLVDLEKIRSIIEWPIPKSVHDIHRFYSLATFYGRFIRGFSSIIVPMTDYLRKDSFNWTSVVNRAFLDIKNKMTQAPTLRLLDFSKEIGRAHV